jgi:hypothetical protein
LNFIYLIRYMLVVMNTQFIYLFIYLFTYLFIYLLIYLFTSPICGLVVRVLGYRSRDPGFGSQRYQIF